MFSLSTSALSVLLVASASVSSVLAADHVVMVGKDASGASKLVFTPESLTAAAGDSITFQTFATHTATVSSFADPCKAMTGSNAFDVGGTPGNYTYNVTAATPTWFYCKTGNHCAAGQVFALNPTADKTFAMFQATAMGGASGTKTNGTATPSKASGSAAASKGAAGSAKASASAKASSAASAASSGGRSYETTTAAGVVAAGLLLSAVAGTVGFF